MSEAEPRRWERSYARRLIITDVVVIAVAIAATQIVSFGLEYSELAVRDRTTFDISYTLVSIFVGSAWLIMLNASGTRDRRLVGSGFTEYKRITDATFQLFGFLALAAYLLKIDLARSYFLTALPIGLFMILFSRWLWRQWLHAKRSRGLYTSRALLVGSRAKTEHVAEGIRREQAAGLVVAAAVIPQGTRGDTVSGYPVLGDFSTIIPALEECRADTIVLTGSDELPHDAVRRLSWELEERGINLIVIPALTDVAGPRIHTRPVAGLPLIHVEFPQFTGRKNVVKRLFDIAISITLLVLLSPVFLVISILIRADGPGKAFFYQQRVGLGGRDFRLVKFRSMTTGAESQLSSLLDQNEGNSVLFKLRNDPRVTRVGRFLRRYSLDELPQLINVLKGDMSFVGPRPPLRSEVDQYNEAMARRLLVKPGITGLWQVSGRSNLSWEDSIRFDLYYVENWSLTGDFILIYRTVRAVLRADGAY